MSVTNVIGYTLQMVKNFNQMSFGIICTFCSHNTELGEQARRFCNVTDILPLWHPCVVVYWNTAHYSLFKVSARTPSHPLRPTARRPTTRLLFSAVSSVPEPAAYRHTIQSERLSTPLYSLCTCSITVLLWVWCLF